MKKKIVIAILICFGLFLGYSVLGAVEYQRIPSDYYILENTTTTFNVELEGCPEGSNSWTIQIWDKFARKAPPPPIPPSHYSPCYSTSTLSQSWQIIFPISDYTAVSYWCYASDICSMPPIEVGPQYFLEGDREGVIFEVVSTLPPPTFVRINKNFVAGIVTYVKKLVGSGLTPFLVMIIGLPFAFVVIKKIIALIPKK